ncbi:DUF456 domain-containing protein [Streptomyces sp. PKU-EA00015]|uniref:DUF456 domain-containing protein n=1 Tax=Streptomyces sp. PKU-EA00015 TaxID=2748326 RepID=UPI00159FEF17|nr:DUF456 domain-containing protein [Streptomyces sp. PKU-EA00015]NWF29252.1 DUF456 domain-containing protein [Streptomyces sp. PKU-EA00015]
MGMWQLLMVGGVMLLGLLGVLLPGVPGRWLVWAAVLWWAMHEASGPAWALLVGATVVLLINQVVVWLLPPRRLKGAAITRRAALYAGVGALVGFVVVPVVGAVPGFIGGIYVCERRRLGGHGQAKASTRSAMRAAGTSMLVELFGCLLVVGAWVAVVLGG